MEERSRPAWLHGARVNFSCGLVWPFSTWRLKWNHGDTLSACFPVVVYLRYISCLQSRPVLQSISVLFHFHALFSHWKVQSLILVLFFDSILSIILPATMWAKSLLTASAAASLLGSAVEAGVIPLLPRNDYPAQPPCMYPYTPFVYSGCYVDPSLPTRALDWSPDLNSQNMTVELCTSSCKGTSYPYDVMCVFGPAVIALTIASKWLPVRGPRVLWGMFLRRCCEWTSCALRIRLLVCLHWQQCRDLRRLRFCFHIYGSHFHPGQQSDHYGLRGTWMLLRGHQRSRDSFSAKQSACKHHDN